MAESSGSHQDRSRVAQACENCREKKSKCDGAKPTCGRCRLRSLKCHYGASRKVKNQQAMRLLAEKVAQYEGMLRKNIPTQQMIHHGDSISAEQSLAASVQATPTSTSAYSEAKTGLSDAKAANPWSALPVHTSVSPLELLSQTDALSHETEVWGNVFADSMPLPPRWLLEQACSAFFEASTVLFTFFEEEKIVTLFNNVYGGRPAPEAKTSLTQLCAAASVGCQFYPQRFHFTSRTALLSIVKLNVDDCIEEAPLSAMRMLCLLCMYYTFEKRTAALLYVDMGLELARMNGSETMFWQDPSTPWQRVFGSLVFLQGWLCATTGQLPSSQNRELYSSVMLMGSVSSSIDSVVQYEMFKIAIMSISIVQNVYHARFVSSTTIESYKNQLQQWLFALPEYMRLDYLHEHGQYLRPIFLIHLLYTNTVILAYRRILVELAHLGLKLSDIVVFNQARSFLGPCLWTGRQVAKILEIALSQDQVLQKCWMVINATYTTCNVLLYFATSQLIQEESSDEVSHDIAAAGQCMKLLAFCSEIDEAASEYFCTTNILYLRISQIYESTKSDSKPESQRNLNQHKDQLYQLLAATASLLIHPFDGGFRRVARRVHEFFQESSEEASKMSTSPKIPEDNFAKTSSAERTPKEIGTNFFMSDFPHRNNFGPHLRDCSKDEESVEGSEPVSFTSDFSAVFGT